MNSTYTVYQWYCNKCTSSTIMVPMVHVQLGIVGIVVRTGVVYVHMYVHVYVRTFTYVPTWYRGTNTTSTHVQRGNPGTCVRTYVRTYK